MSATRWGRKGRAGTPPSQLLYRVVRDALVAFARVYLRLQVVGREHVPTSGPFVVAPVHRSNLDFFLAASIQRKRQRYMGKDSLWKVHPAFSWFLSSLGGYPVARGAADREALRTTVSLVQAGEPVVLFPEGQRQSGPEVQPLFDGAAYVASRCQVPILPVGIGGSERAMPKGARFIRPRRVAVVIGPPLPPAPMKEGGTVSRRGVKELTEQLHKELQRLFDDAQRLAGQPADQPVDQPEK